MSQFYPFSIRSIYGDVASVASPGMLSETQRAALSAELPCKVKSIKKPKKDVINIDLGSASQARQLGYACAQAKSGQWSAVKEEEHYVLFNLETGETFRVSDGHEVTGKAHEIVDGETHTVEIAYLRPSVKKLVDDKWIEQPITPNVHKAVNNGRMAKITPWTWYHIIARYLCNEQVAAIKGEFEAEVEWGYRLEMFKLANGNPASIRRLSTATPCEGGGWQFEAHYQGSANPIPALLDTRFIDEQQFTQAVVAAVVTEGGFQVNPDVSNWGLVD
jgi:hypothetical protein